MTESLGQLIRALAERSAFSVIGKCGFNSEPLRQRLAQMLTAEAGIGDSFLADPVFEGAFGWEAATQTMADLAGGLLDPGLVRVLDDGAPIDPLERNTRYRFARDWHPHQHQLEAWRLLLDRDPRSVLVTSGTGSGKTECFLVPILSDLARQCKDAGRLSGVQAIFLYPLNALINSQRDRLTDWTHGFDGNIRFCLYNGETPEEVKQADQARRSSQVLSRKELRNNPPPILVTNVTMLEYMLVRANDAPIIGRSRGKLRWIVLDEAHSYVGSQAAELSLLLRRVLRAFGVRGEEVRFIATSATIGEGEAAKASLRDFLADMAGIAPDRVTVIEGRRHVPDLSIDETKQLPHPAMAELRASLARGPMKLEQVVRKLFPSAAPSSPTVREQTLNLLETSARTAVAGQSLLPLRVHLFHRSQAGLWACLNPCCGGRTETPLAHDSWPYGKLFAGETDSCDVCGSPAFELVGCNECNSPFLAAAESPDGVLSTWHETEESDEFSQDAEPPEAQDSEEDQATGSPSRRLITRVGLPHTEACWFDLDTGRIVDQQRPGTFQIGVHRSASCPICRTLENPGEGPLFIPARLGAPFLLGNIIPELIAAAPPHAPGDEPMPAEGRQLITFTDSRQGTARLAAKLQQDSERALVRSVVYHFVQERASATGNQPEILELEGQLAQLEAVKASVPDLYDSLSRKLAQLRSGGTPPTWQEAIRRLANEPDLHRWVHDVWQDRDTVFSDAGRLAEVLLYREFLRRPKRQNSAETMGLAALRFDHIDRLPEQSLPSLFRQKGVGLKDWQDFLYVLLTHLIRGSSAVAIDRDALRWIGREIPPRQFVRPDGEAARTKLQKPWPRAGLKGSTSGPVLQLMAALKLDRDDPAHRDLIDEALRAAWTAVVPLGKIGAEGYQLDLSHARIGAVEAAWLCHVTGRVVDRTFRGQTPYLPRGEATRPLQCMPITLPRLPFPCGIRNGERVEPAEIRAWLSGDPVVQAVREKGVWTDLHDRIALSSPYIRAAEHSAQQSSARLQAYEKLFKKGQINVLCCSTTMEMGVDIGGISTVVMTNVPPQPANYRQRVGRAGRRQEALAFGFTFCSDNPLGWTVFRNPTWPFDQAIRAPSVSLNSPVIVQRHINALLLSAYLKSKAEQAGKDLPKLECGWYLVPSASAMAAGKDDSPSEDFCRWCEAPDGIPKPVAEDLAAVTQFTCLDGQADLRFDVAEQLRQVRELWLNEWRVLDGDLRNLPAEDQGARRAIEMQKKRLEEEYLLKELASRGFLPGYGFPTNVVSFYNTTAADRRPRGGETWREDNRFSSRGFPTRQLDLAIRDYAPGAEIVLDGMVYKSGGVTLNWKRPATEEGVREIQAIGHAWRCRSCNMTHAGTKRPAVCSACGGTELDIKPFLQPAGFAVDVRDKPHTDITRPTYLPPTKPWISARDGIWSPLPDASVGRHRMTRNGHVFHYSLGVEGQGYAVCLHCGRAEAEHLPPGPQNPLPKAMAEHRPLRGTAGQPLGLCPGLERSFGIRRNLMLGYGLSTDVFELNLAELKDETTAASLAVALRETLARRLGIEPGEISWAVVRAPDGSQRIFLYDRATGGAGFASQAGILVAGLLEDDVPGFLKCRNPRCVTACHACLLTRDSQYDEAHLDRRKALDFWNAHLKGRLSLAPSLKVFGAGTRAEPVAALEAIDREMHLRRSAELHVWLDGAPTEWDFASWPAVPLLEKWGAKNRRLYLCVAEDVLVVLTPRQKVRLAALLARTRGRLRALPDLPRLGEGLPLAAALDQNGGCAWAVFGKTARIPAAEWGRQEEQPLVSGPGGMDLLTGEVVDQEAVLDDRSERGSIVRIFREADGAITDFGIRFWSHAVVGKPEIAQLVQHGGTLSAIEYQDRYLFGPLAVRLLSELLRPLVKGRKPSLRILTLPEKYPPSSSAPWSWAHDWESAQVRDTVLRSTMGRLGLELQLECQSRTLLPHERCLRLSWSSGASISLYLDHGLGHWETSRRMTFDFTESPDDQAASLISASFNIQARPPYPMLMFIVDAKL